MYVYFQELVIIIILEILRLIEGIYHIYNYLFGSTDITNNGNDTYLLDQLFNHNEISNIFNCVILISILLGCIYSVISIIQNAVKNNRSISSIISNFVISILIIFIISLVSLIMIDITNEGFRTICKIFDVDLNINIGHQILDICVMDYNNSYSINEIDFNAINSKVLLGDQIYASYQLFPVNWKNNGYINPNSFLYLPCLITSIIVLFCNIYIAIELVKRVYELVLLYIVMPITVFTITIDDGYKLKQWIKLFIKKLLLVYAIYISIYLFIFIYQYLTKVYIHFNTYEFKILNLLFIIGGSLLVIVSQKIFNMLYKEKILIKQKNKKGETYENNA